MIQPPLPEPDRVAWHGGKAHSEDQLIAYGEACIEMCAKEFDRRDNGIGFYDPHEPAEIIRSLK